MQLIWTCDTDSFTTSFKPCTVVYLQEYMSWRGGPDIELEKVMPRVGCGIILLLLWPSNILLLGRVHSVLLHLLLPFTALITQYDCCRNYLLRLVLSLRSTIHPEWPSEASTFIGGGSGSYPVMQSKPILCWFIQITRKPKYSYLNRATIRHKQLPQD